MNVETDRETGSGMGSETESDGETDLVSDQDWAGKWIWRRIRVSQMTNTVDGKDLSLYKKVPALEPSGSSAFKAFGYVGSKQAFYVQFASGSVWCYTGIDQAIVTAFQNAESRGGYFAKEIKAKAKEAFLVVTAKTS